MKKRSGERNNVISDELEDISEDFFNLCQNFLKIDPLRAMRILNHLLNLTIMAKYFPGIIRKEQILRFLRGMNSSPELDNKIRDKEKKIKQIYPVFNFMLFILLKYNNLEYNISKTKTTLE